MSMVNTASLEPGARSLPAELRVPRGNAWGWNRLHGNLTPVTESARRFHPPSRGVSGLGACYYDDSDLLVCDDGYGATPVTVAPGTDWATILSQSTGDLARILAITQGGSVSASGNIYGSPGTATVAAGFPQNQISVGSGVFGNISTPLLLLGVGLVALMVLKK